MTFLSTTCDINASELAVCDASSLGLCPRTDTSTIPETVRLTLAVLLTELGAEGPTSDILVILI